MNPPIDIPFLPDLAVSTAGTACSIPWDPGVRTARGLLDSPGMAGLVARREDEVDEVDEVVGLVHMSKQILNTVYILYIHISYIYIYI